MAIADPDYECLYADVGTNGRVNDGGVWNKSVMFEAIKNGTVQFPDDGYLHSNTVKAPYVLLGDDAFALKRYMMKPYPQQNLTLDKRIYNYRHSRVRRISENLGKQVESISYKYFVTSRLNEFINTHNLSFTQHAEKKSWL